MKQCASCCSRRDLFSHRIAGTTGPKNPRLCQTIDCVFGHWGIFYGIRGSCFACAMIISECREPRPKLCQNIANVAGYVHGEFGSRTMRFVQMRFSENVTTSHKRLVLVEVLRTRRAGAPTKCMMFLTKVYTRCTLF